MLSVIGKGGMGIVYKARHRELNRTVAIKMLRGSVLEDPEIRLRFNAEAEAVARLQHPNIIQVFEVGTVEAAFGDGHCTPYIALEFVEGGSLEERTETPQTPQFSARMVEKLARAAHAAHQVGVVHRDLKPANVLLTASGEPKIADFGVAKQVATERTSAGRFVTQAGTTVGTPEYMAPEQVWGDAPTGSIDVYALGVILYELLTGHLPIQAATAMETMELVIHQEPVSPRMFQPKLPRDLETICLKCLQKNADRRYLTAEALADDLKRWYEGQPIHARPVGRVERGIRWVNRNPSVAVLSTLVVLVTIIGVAGVFVKWREAQAHAADAVLEAKRADERAAAERWGGYLANVLAATNALQVQNDSAARRSLDAAPEEHRNWEWKYFNQRLDVSSRKLQVAVGPVLHERMSRDCESIAIFSGQDSARFWNLATGEEFGSFRYPEMLSPELGPGGKLVAVTMPDASIVVRDLSKNETRAVLRGHKALTSEMRFNRDGSRLATGASESGARVWDTRTGALLFVLDGHEHSPGKLEFSNDDRWIATTGGPERIARIWDGSTGQLVTALPKAPENVLTTRFSPEGDRVLTVENFPSCTMKLWETKTGKLLGVMPGHLNQIRRAEFSPDGSLIASASMDQTVRVWNGQDGQLVSTLKGHKGWATCVRFTPDGKQVVSGSADHTLRLWDPRKGETLAVLYGHLSEVLTVGFMKDQLISYSDDGMVHYWDLEKIGRDNRLIGHKTFVYGVSMHPDGKQVASASWDGTVRVWNPSTGQQLKCLDHGEKKTLTSIAYHPGGEMLATYCRDSGVHLWDVETEKQLHCWKVPGDSWRDTRIAFSPNGELLAVGCNDFSVRLFDVATKAESAVLKGHGDVIRDVAFSPDGRWLASAGDNDDATIRIWDLATRRQIQILKGHTERVYCLAFQGDGKLLASGSWDGTVRLWNPRSGQQLAQLRHGAKVYSLAISPDRTRLASACSDNTIRMWDLATRQEVAELRGHSDYVHGIVFSPDGTRLVSASGDFTLRVWDSQTEQSRTDNP